MSKQEELQEVTRGVFLRAKGVARKTGGWLWSHKKPILVNMTWLWVGAIIGAVRVIPPPEKFIKFGLFRIGT